MSDTTTASATPRLRGFALPGYASRFGKLAHAMGVAHRWTREEAAAAGRKGAVARRQAQLRRAPGAAA